MKFSEELNCLEHSVCISSSFAKNWEAQFSFLSSPIACVAFERTELLKTEKRVVVVILHFCSFVIASFCLAPVTVFLVIYCMPMVCIPMLCIPMVCIPTQ